MKYVNLAVKTFHVVELICVVSLSNWMRRQTVQRRYEKVRSNMRHSELLNPWACPGTQAHLHFAVASSASWQKMKPETWQLEVELLHWSECSGELPLLILWYTWEKKKRMKIYDLNQIPDFICPKKEGKVSDHLFQGKFLCGCRGLSLLLFLIPKIKLLPLLLCGKWHDRQNNEWHFPNFWCKIRGSGSLTVYSYIHFTSIVIF